MTGHRNSHTKRNRYEGAGSPDKADAVAQHVSRAVRRILPPADVVMAAARKFAVGEITLQDLQFILRCGSEL